MKPTQILCLILLGLCSTTEEFSNLWAQQNKPKNAVALTEFLVNIEGTPSRQKDKVKMGFGQGRIHVQLQPRRGEGTFQFGKRVMENWRNRHQKIVHYNQNRPLHAGRFVPFPFSSLKGSLQGLVLRGLFANDTAEERGWAHRITYPGETMSFVAGVFAKQGISSTKLAQYNKLKNRGEKIGMGETVIIPWQWLRTELDLQPIAVRPPLVRGKGAKNRHYAYYQLKKGEAIYSSVVIRFTGRILPQEVNRLAKQLLALNHITDPKKIPLKQKIKIPLEWLSEDYLLDQKPQRVAAVAPQKQKPRPQKRANSKAAVHIILDAGHGGNDPGAVAGSKKAGDLVYEDEVVYDIMLRMKSALHAAGYKVHPTLKDPNQSKPRKHLKTRDRDEILLVHPAYNLANSGVGVNFRVYLANYIYKKLLKQKVPKENIVFMSLHGDARHKSLRGAMVFYPDSRLRMKVFDLQKNIYRRRKEYKKEISFSQKENLQVAAASKSFGETLIQTLQTANVLTHKPRALRSYHYRNGERTLPAILRYSKVPISVLVEVANLTNPQDRRNILKAKNRQKIADALVQGIQNHFNKKMHLQVALR